MLRIALIALVIIVLVHLVESFFSSKKVINIDINKLKTLRRFFGSDTAVIVSRAIRHTIEMEQWRNDRAQYIKEHEKKT